VEIAILARHGESELSVVGRTNGDPGLPFGLTEAGRRQALRLGELLASERLDLCVVTEFPRSRETADLALGGREVPRLVLPELNDISFGVFEGLPLADYRRWARAHGPEEPAPGGGESRAAIASRYADGYRTILARPEQQILVVAHGLPIRYLLLAVEGRDPAPAVEQVPYAEPIRIDSRDLAGAVERLEAWAKHPTWGRSEEP
jgi:broad specificity phosphatase PhoE